MFIGNGCSERDIHRHLQRVTQSHRALAASNLPPSPETCMPYLSMRHVCMSCLCILSMKSRMIIGLDGRVRTDVCKGLTLEAIRVISVLDIAKQLRGHTIMC